MAAWARDLFGLDRLGHGGTLDPFATGVLPLMAGRCMKITNKVLKHRKSYIAVFRFKTPPTEGQLDEIMGKMTGRIYNVPPEVSAVKVQVRTRKIFKFERLDFNEKDMVARITCEAGTYIRTMARDMGLMLGSPVELKELRREHSGMFSLDDCVTMDTVADAVWLWKECDDASALMRIVQPIEKLLVDVPRCILITSLKGEAVGFVKLTVNTDEIGAMENGEVARPSMVLMDTEVYPRRWVKQA